MPLILTNEPYENSEKQYLLPCVSDTRLYQSINDDTPKATIKIYKRRWWILAMFALVAHAQALCWITWSSISESAKLVFGWSDSTIALLQDWGNIPFVVLGIPICWLLDKQGLRITVVLSTLFMFCGAGLRCISYEPHIATPLIHVGQILNGISGVALTGAPSQLSAIWFPTNERTTATSIACLCNTMGICMGFLLGPLVINSAGPPPCNNERWGNLTNGCSNYTSGQTITYFDHYKHRVMCLMYLEFAISAILLFAVCIYFPEKPPLPPTASAKLDRLELKTSLCQLIRNKNFWIIASGFAVTNAVFANWLSLLGTVLQPLKITQDQASRMAMFGTLVGCILSLVMARIVDLVGGFIKLCLFILWTIGCANFIVYTCIYMGILPSTLTVLYPCAIIAGILAYSPCPLYMELTSEVTYPVSEGTVGVCLQVLVNTIGSLYLLILLIPNIGLTWMNWCLIGAAVIGMLLAIFQKETYERSNVDKNAIKYESDISA